jgi:DNA modification methylase
MSTGVKKLARIYYEHAGITIYHGDCREILAGGGIVADLLLTDPPYGIGKDGQDRSTGGHGGRKAYEFLGWDQSRPDKELFALLLKAAPIQIIWGGNYFADLLPATGKWLVWDKGQRINQSDGELAWTSMDGALRILTLNRCVLAKDVAVHPTQKPLALMQWCIKQAYRPGMTICDPFMGSGSTLVAAKNMQCSAIGIEREERFCEIAANRLQQETLWGEMAC